MSNAANSMVSNANIIKKIYFPRLIIPISSILVALVDFFIALVIFAVAIICYKVEINYNYLLFIPLSIFSTCLSAIGLGAFLAALNIKYRDVRYVLPFFVQGLLFLTPVLYPSSISSNHFIQIALNLNPMSGALELFRSIFIGSEINEITIIFSSITSILLFVLGIFYFRKTENYFADLA